jgi:hypothetical protein
MNTQQVYQAGFEAGVKFAALTNEPKVKVVSGDAEAKRQERLRKQRVYSKRYFARKRAAAKEAKEAELKEIATRKFGQNYGN